MTGARRLIVIGGDAGGMSAASQVRRRQPLGKREIIAFERGPDTSFSACGIPYWIGGAVGDRDDLIAREPQEFRERQQIDVRTGSLVTAIDLEERTVRVTELATGREYSEPFDDLMIATGATPLRPKLPGINGERVVDVHTLDDGARIRALLESHPVHNVVVVGAGYIGLEVAEAMAERGMAVTIVDQSKTPMNTLDPDMGERIVRGIKETAIDLVLDDGVAQIQLDDAGGAKAVVTKSGRVLTADLVVLGIGVRPNVELAAKAGIKIGPTGAIAVDRRMRTSAAGVWAAGDCVESCNVLTRRPVNVALGTHANKQGRIAGDNIAGVYAAFHGVLGTAATKICRVEIARTGLSTQEAKDAGFEVVAVAVESTTRAGYLPDAQKICVKLIAERGTGRLLGGQIVGYEESAKRIDILALAIWKGMTAEEFFAADLSYAPPFSPVLDPVVIAARKTHDAVMKDAHAGGGRD
jgi:NADPH-dependent 2,4-dienoyl-CoA reductase/sulfur reductase-like enzyme